MTQLAAQVHSIKLPGHHRRKAAAKILNAGRPAPSQQQPSTPPIRVVCISDTHNLTPNLPNGDILIHAGDLSEWGTFDEIQAQLTWLSNQPHQHKVIIAGNHDLLLDPDFLDSHPKYKDPQARTKEDLDFGSVMYLQDESLTLCFPERKTSLNIYGSPWTPQYGTSAFQYPREQNIWTGSIPPSTDILITHGPPTGFPNVRPSAGCPFLREEVARVSPQLMVFGHIHVARGEETIVFDWAQAVYDDIADGSRGWEAFPLLVVAVLWSRFRWLFQKKSVRSTRMINAAVVEGMKKDVALEAFVVEL